MPIAEKFRPSVIAMIRGVTMINQVSVFGAWFVRGPEELAD